MRTVLGRNVAHGFWSAQSAAVAAYAAVNIALISLRTPQAHMDWLLWEVVSSSLSDGEMYGGGSQVPFLWSPLMAPVMALFNSAPWLLVLAHFLVLPLLRSPLLIGLVLVSYGFWADIANMFTFVMVSGVLAWRGSRPAALVYIGLFLLMPRPVQLPLALLLVARMPSIRLAAAALTLSQGLAVLTTGMAAAWVSAMVEYGTGAHFDIGLTYHIGMWWLVLGIPLALILTVGRRPAWAGLMMSPYLLPQYFLILLVEDWHGACHQSRMAAGQRNEAGTARVRAQ